MSNPIPAPSATPTEMPTNAQSTGKEHEMSNPTEHDECCDYGDLDADRIVTARELELRDQERDRSQLVGYLIRFGHRIEAAARWNGAHYEAAGPGGRPWPLDKAQGWADAALADEKSRPEPYNAVADPTAPWNRVVGPKVAHAPEFWNCPECGVNDGYLNIGRGHWFYCQEHRTRWYAGANLFDSWKHETEAEQRARYEEMDFGTYTTVGDNQGRAAAADGHFQAVDDVADAERAILSAVIAAVFNRYDDRVHTAVAAYAAARKRAEPVEAPCCDFADIAPCEVRTARCMPL